MNTARIKPPGALKISGNAVLKIAETAAAEVEGASLRPDASKGILSLFSPPVRVRLGADATVIDVSVFVVQGYKAQAVAESIQEGVKSAVQNMTGIAVSKVNVKIAGICSPKNE